MSQKSVVKDIRDIFENETKCPTFKTTCEQGDSRDTYDKERVGRVDSKDAYQNKHKETPNKHQPIRRVYRENLKGDFPKYGTIRDRINKLNAEKPLPRASTIFSSNLQTADSSKRPPSWEQRAVDGSNLQKATHIIQKFHQCETKNTLKDVKKEPDNIISQPSIKITKCETETNSDNSSHGYINSIKELNERKIAKSEIRTNSDNSSHVYINSIKEINERKIAKSETRTNSDNSSHVYINSIKEINGRKIAKSETETSSISTNSIKKLDIEKGIKGAMEQSEFAQRSPGVKGNFPMIPPKPKYLNKIKPHPNMPSSSKQQLKEKIKLFNNLSAVAEKFESATSTENTPCTSPRHRKSNFEEIWNFKEGNSAISNKIHLEIQTKLNSNNSCDALQNNSANSKLRPAPKPPQKGNTDNDSKIKRPKSKAAKNIQNIRTLSKDHSLESEGFVVVKISERDDDDYDSVSEDSSDEDLATEYDVIENLNVTKVTVERRYKVTDNAEEDPATFNVKRETYYDHNLNPRIERISRQVQRRLDDCSNNVCSNQTYPKKSTYVIQELVQSEMVYFTGLLRVYEDYIVYFMSSTDICAETLNMGKVFGNFEEIYKAQMNFCGQLTECGENVDAIAEIFLKNENLFNLYEKYIINLHVSKEYSAGECLDAIRARDIELGNKLNLQSYLLTPFQRLFRYPLLLKNLQEALKNENDPNEKLDAAICYLDDFIEGTNLHLKVAQGIQNSPIDLSSRGKLLMMDDCYVRKNGKKYVSTVILFDDIIIFTKKTDSDTYIYKGSINLSDLYIRSITEEMTSFQLQNFTQFKKKHDNKYVYDLEVRDPETKQEWVKKLESLLWNQFEAYRK